MRTLLAALVLVVPVTAWAQSPLTPRASYFAPEASARFRVAVQEDSRERCGGLTLTNVLIGAQAVSEYADATSTMLCVGSGRCAERNAILKPIVQRPLLFAGIKGGQAAVLSWLLIKYRCSHPTLVRVTAATLAVYFTYFSYRNASFSPGGLGVLEP